VKLDRVLTDLEFRGDVAISLSEAQQSEHLLLLPPRQVSRCLKAARLSQRHLLERLINNDNSMG